jgi:hypothetical protein
MPAQEFRFLRAVCEPDARLDARFVIGAMFTPNYSKVAERLWTSCRAHSLPVALFEVPEVHQSISPRGGHDPAYTKANFIRFVLERYARPVFYLDADCVLAQRPTLIDDLLASHIDFAAFNWLAEEHTEAYLPARVLVKEGGASRVTLDRFYQFSFSVDWMSEALLICSGAVLWFNTTPGAELLLAQWQRVVERAPPRSADDQCLDFAFNHYPSEGPALRTRWWDKSYVRYGWWIYVRPVIDHPHLPLGVRAFEPLEWLDGAPRVDDRRLEQRTVSYIFPRDCLIDTETRQLVRPHEGQLLPVGTISHPLWLNPDRD